MVRLLGFMIIVRACTVTTPVLLRLLVGSRHVIDAWPGDTDVTLPSAPTVAMPGVADAHWNVAPDIAAPAASSATHVNVPLSPMPSSSEPGAMLTAAGTGFA